MSSRRKSRQDENGFRTKVSSEMPISSEVSFSSEISLSSEIPISSI